MLLAIAVVLLPDFCCRFCGESTEWKLQQLDDKLNDLLSGKSAQFDLNCSPKKSNSTFTMAPVKDALFALKVVGPMLLPNVYCPWREVEGQFRFVGISFRCSSVVQRFLLPFGNAVNLV